MFRKSDLVLQKPPETLAPKVFKMRALLPFIHFWVDNVFPSQPITARWRFNLCPSAGVNSVRVRFLIEP